MCLCMVRCPPGPSIRRRAPPSRRGARWHWEARSACCRSAARAHLGGDRDHQTLARLPPRGCRGHPRAGPPRTPGRPRRRPARRARCADLRAQVAPCCTACAAAPSARLRLAARSRCSVSRYALRELSARPSRLADGGADLDARGDVEVAHEAPDHERLLVVLLTEEGDVRLAHVEELRDDRRDAGEVAPGRGRRARRTGRRSGPGPRPTWRIPSGRPPRRRGEQQVRAGRGGKLRVTPLVARIALEVLARAELGRVHEQAHDHEPAWSAAARTRLRWPSCREPIVGTSPIERPGARGRHRGAQRRDRADGSQVHGFIRGRSSSLIAEIPDGRLDDVPVSRGRPAGWSIPDLAG